MLQRPRLHLSSPPLDNKEYQRVQDRQVRSIVRKLCKVPHGRWQTASTNSKMVRWSTTRPITLPQPPHPVNKSIILNICTEERTKEFFECVPQLMRYMQSESSSMYVWHFMHQTAYTMNTSNSQCQISTKTTYFLNIYRVTLPTTATIVIIEIIVTIVTIVTIVSNSYGQLKP